MKERGIRKRGEAPRKKRAWEGGDDGSARARVTVKWDPVTDLEDWDRKKDGSRDRETHITREEQRAVLEMPKENYLYFNTAPRTSLVSRLLGAFRVRGKKR